MSSQKFSKLESKAACCWGQLTICSSKFCTKIVRSCAFSGGVSSFPDMVLQVCIFLPTAGLRIAAGLHNVFTLISPDIQILSSDLSLNIVSLANKSILGAFQCIYNGHGCEDHAFVTLGHHPCCWDIPTGTES